MPLPPVVPPVVPPAVPPVGAGAVTGSLEELGLAAGLEQPVSMREHANSAVAISTEKFESFFIIFKFLRLSTLKGRQHLQPRNTDSKTLP